MHAKSHFLKLECSIKKARIEPVCSKPETVATGNENSDSLQAAVWQAGRLDQGADMARKV
jgi:hypothetical protein